MTDGTAERSSQPADDVVQVSGTEENRQGVTEEISAPPPPVIPPVTRDDVIRAEPARPALWAALLYALATIALGFSAFAGKFLAGQYSDQFVAGYAFREFGAAMLKATGGFAQWNPYLFGGMPYVAAMHGDIFYPTFLLRMVMPTDASPRTLHVSPPKSSSPCTLGLSSSELGTVTGRFRSSCRLPFSSVNL